MKRVHFILFGIMFIATGIFIDRWILTAPIARADQPTIIAQAVSKTKNRVKDWVAKIDQTTITLGDFRREFNVHVYSLPADKAQKEKYKSNEANKKKFLTNLINEYLIYRKAVSEGYDKRPFVKDLLKAVTRRAIIQVYLNEKIEPKLKEPTDQQIEAIYNQNKKLFTGVDIDVARQQIRMQLLQRQYNEYLNDLIDELKGEAKVVRNDNIKL